MKNCIPVILFLLVLGCFAGCSAGQTRTSSVRRNVVLLDYRDFGPQVIAHEVIGMEWWQWLPHGHSRPTVYRIKVIVYRGISLERVKGRFPVTREKKADFRYLEFNVAMSYLDRKIKDNIMDAVSDRLRNTRRVIIAKLLESKGAESK